MSNITLTVDKSQDNWKSASQSYELSATISNGKVTEKLYIAGWNNMINLPGSESTETKMLEKNSIDSFEKFQTANIQKLSDAIAGKSPEESLAYLNSLQEAFAFEIWERKEKSWAAEVLKGQIKKTVESEKTRILPEYNPANLTKATRSRKKIETVGETKKNSVVELMKKLGISEADAEACIKQTIAQTFEMSAAKLTPQVSQFKKCPKCGGLNPTSMAECMICKTNIKECEYCKNFTKDKDSKTCKEHESEGK